MPSTMLPDALADALGRVVADVQREARNEASRYLELITAKSDAVIAQLAGRVIELEAQVRAFVDREGQRVTAALANIKDGERGLQGEPGAPGATGLPGERGPQGALGERGEAGMAGERGPPGDKGDTGLPGARGEKGEPGPTGERGEAGLQGDEGPEGKPARDGRDGLPGINGKDGDPGKDGADGKDGRDGFSLEDFKASSPDDGRKLELTFARGDVVKSHSIKTALVLDRGVYRPGQYSKGDGVTFGGSFFIAQQDTDTKPETGPEWRLAVKRGRDGKDGQPGLPGSKGDPGVPGKDGKW